MANTVPRWSYGRLERSARYMHTPDTVRLFISRWRQSPFYYLIEQTRRWHLLSRPLADTATKGHGSTQIPVGLKPVTFSVGGNKTLSQPQTSEVHHRSRVSLKSPAQSRSLKLSVARQRCLSLRSLRPPGRRYTSGLLDKTNQWEFKISICIKDELLRLNICTFANMQHLAIFQPTKSSNLTSSQPDTVYFCIVSMRSPKKSWQRTWVANEYQLDLVIHTDMSAKSSPKHQIFASFRWRCPMT